ncbi:hypothetical protein BBJ28_00001785 [Nothophytophthora sp. Chile5]|nr:hypothetical protein BBJ28_00001785 [Nothophytophthora sp. Chile5]
MAPAAASKDDARARGEQKQAPVAARSRLTLERVLGVTALSNAMMAVNPVTGELAYAAGCIVVVYNLRRNRQVRYYRVDKSVACLCFSPSGQFLAIGEKGYLPAITIWDGTDGTLCAELQRHQYGIACMAFSRDGRFLLSAGLVHDQHLYAWELTLDGAPRRMKATAVGCALLEDKVLAADYCEAGNFFVTVGEKHFKHRDAVISAKTSATFTDVGCGYGACKLKTFAVTADGTLCCFGASGIMERLVSLEATCGNSLSVTESYVAVGGSSAIVRLFDPLTLEYRATLPFPPAFGTANESPTSATIAMNELHPDEPRRYPAVIAVRITGSHAIALYSDRSIFIYDTANPEAVTVERSFLFHSGGIRDLQVVGQLRGVNAKGRLVYHGGDAPSEAAAGTIPNGTFVTCSDDNTVRLWHLELHRRPVKSSRFDPSSGSVERLGYEPWKNPYSQEMLRVIYNDQETEFANEHAVVLGGTCSHEARNEVHSPAKNHQRVNGLRTVAIRSDQKQIAAGDREGNIMLASLSLGAPVVHIGAHSSEVQCLVYSGLGGETGAADARNFMASGGKDQLVHVYDCGKGHAVLSTLENHSAAVTAVAFTRNGKKLLSCGADKNVAISDISPEAKLMRSRLVPVAGGKVFDMVLASDSDSIVTACGNRLDILSANTGKHIQTLHVGEQHHIALCPADHCVAMSGSLSERTIHVVDISTGETLATGTGHGEAITAIKFTPDCRRLLSASGDGCIFVWRLSEEIQSEIKAKLPRVKETQGPTPAPPARTDNALMAPALPPPAPPLSAPRSTHITDQNTTTTMVNDADAEAKKRSIAAGRSESKKSPRDWKGRGVAVPGPMADIPMDDWMRTRETAKPTIHVVDDGPSGQIIELEAAEVREHDGGVALSIDRSQTPDWARTVLPAAEAGHPAKIPPLEEVALHQNVFVGEKWSNRVASSLPVESKQEAVQAAEDRNNGGEQASRTTKSQLSSQREGDCTPLSAPSQAIVVSDAEGTPPTQFEEDERVSLSVNILGNNTAISTSLALEREQLEKRRKQIDTAKAVAAMNTRLSQLGLLKSQHKSGPQQNPEIKSSLSPPKWQQTARSTFDREANSSSDSSSGSSDVHDTKPDAASSLEGLTKVTDAIAQDSHPDIPIEMFESIEFPPPSAIDAEVKVLPTEDPHPSTTEQRQDSRWQRNSAAASAEDLSRTVEFEYAASSSDAGEDAASGGLVDEALDAATSELTSASLVPASKQVAASLSTLTAGYEASGMEATQTKQHDDVIARNLSGKTPDFDVAASLSAFTSGFEASPERPKAGDGAGQGPLEPSNAVASSMSAFTSGYSNKQSSSGGESASVFAPGSSTATDTSVANVRQSTSSGVMVDASLSNFTSGYGADREPTTEESLSPVKVDWTTGVTSSTALAKASFSAYTSGYGAEVSPLSMQETLQVVSAASKGGVDVQPPSRLDAIQDSEVGNSELPKGKQRTVNTLDQSLSSMTIGFEISKQSVGSWTERGIFLLRRINNPIFAPCQTRFYGAHYASKIELRVWQAFWSLINMALDETEKKLDMSLEQIVQERKAEATTPPTSALGKAKNTCVQLPPKPQELRL